MRKKIKPAVPELEVFEDIVSISVSFTDHSIVIGMAEGDIDEDGEFIPNLKSVKYTDLGYSAFMELTKSNSKGKLKGNFRKSDIFEFIEGKSK